MKLDIQGITNPFEIQKIAEETADVDLLKDLQLLVISKSIGTAEQRQALQCYIGGRLKHFKGK